MVQTFWDHLILCCKTEVIKNDLSPQWKPVFLNIQQVGGKDNPLILECYNFNTNGKHDLIGKVQKSLAELVKLHASGQGGTLFLPTGGGRNSHNKVLKSRVYLDKFSESVQYSFLDYLSAGFELNFMVAIDFTASNGNPRLPDSLLYIDPSGRPNTYQKAIVEVGEVLQFYDSDKRFPTWGFGARPIDGPVSHCFNLNGSSHYCEDGVVTDLQETKDALVKASDLPLSILIVGVGGADFKEMEILDADKGERLKSSFGRVASRDIVQWRNFSSSSTSSRITYSIFIVHEKQEYPTDSL
nr:protein BONZAI 1-like [Arachis hypogaea]